MCHCQCLIKLKPLKKTTLLPYVILLKPSLRYQGLTWTRIASSIPLAHKFRQCSFPIYIIAIKETTLKISKQKNNEISERQFLILFNTDSQLEFAFHNASKAESTLSMHPEKKKKGSEINRDGSRACRVKRKANKTASDKVSRLQARTAERRSRQSDNIFVFIGGSALFYLLVDL